MKKQPATKVIRLLAFVLVGLVYGPQAFSQNTVLRTNTGASYFIDLNKTTVKEVHEFPSEVCSIQYYDAYGRADYLPIIIYNWKREAVAHYYLEKKQGLNHYDIALNLAEEEEYTLEATNEMGQHYRALIRFAAGEEIVAPEVEIIADLSSIHCDASSDNPTVFRAKIAGGRAPYQVHWYIMNTTMSDLLYRPHFEQVENTEELSSVEVGIPPAYRVMVQVRDACNVLSNRMLDIDCDKGERIYHSVFMTKPILGQPQNRGN